jgi:hypothetical protein
MWNTLAARQLDWQSQRRAKKTADSFDFVGRFESSPSGRMGMKSLVRR